MERIVLEVDDSTGKAYKNFNTATRQKFNTIISEFLKKAINDAENKDYQKMLDEIGFEAASNGLTPEILHELLHS